jgi:hypothetical protein
VDCNGPNKEILWIFTCKDHLENIRVAWEGGHQNGIRIFKMGHADFPTEPLADFSSFSSASGLMLRAQLSV